MKKHLLSLLAVTIAISGYTQKAMVTIVSNYSGYVGPYPIQMRLEHKLSNDSIWGEYSYTRKENDENIYLKGATTPTQTDLSESSYNRKAKEFENTGNFKFTAIDQQEFSGSWIGVKNNHLPVQLKRYENNSIEDFKRWNFELSLYKGREENAGGTIETYTKANAIKIYNAAGQLSQTIAGFDEVMLGDYGEVTLEDFNFDGYTDLKIQIYFPSAVKNDVSFLYFIYNPATKKFASGKQLDDLGYLTFHAKTKEVKSSFADGRGNEGDDFYRWQDGNLYRIRELRTYEDNNTVFYTEYAIRNGKTVKVKEYKK